MIIIKRMLINELGHEISLSVTHDQAGVTISAEGPTSQVELIWTPMEAMAIRELLELLEPSYKKVIKSD